MHFHVVGGQNTRNKEGSTVQPKELCCVNVTDVVHSRKSDCMTSALGELFSENKATTQDQMRHVGGHWISPSQAAKNRWLTTNLPWQVQTRKGEGSLACAHWGHVGHGHVSRRSPWSKTSNRTKQNLWSDHGTQMGHSAWAPYFLQVCALFRGYRSAVLCTLFDASQSA